MQTHSWSRLLLLLLCLSLTFGTWACSSSDDPEGATVLDGVDETDATDTMADENTGGFMRPDRDATMTMPDQETVDPPDVEDVTPDVADVMEVEDEDVMDIEMAMDVPQLCTNTCPFRNNGQCDDTGVGGTGQCALGTDCDDCGPRGGTPTDMDGDMMPMDVCENTCMTANNGMCEDGDAGSVASSCLYGSDCADCGPRPQGGGPTPWCTNNCLYANNGVCDDGDMGSVSSLCTLGSDCADCGARDPAQFLPICNDSCGKVDGLCADGGIGSIWPNPLFNECAYGTDCTDCGSRDPQLGTPRCTNTCSQSGDSICDDGVFLGNMNPPMGMTPALTNTCGAGTDCTDCGIRLLP